MGFILISLMTNFITTAIAIGMPKTYRQGFSSDFEQFFLVRNIFVYFKGQRLLPNRKCYGKNKLCFDREEMLKMAWYSMHIGFWMWQFQWHRVWGCTFRCFWVIVYMYALSWKLIIIGLLLEYFSNITQKTIHEENSHNMFHVSSVIVLFFLMGRSRTFCFGIRIKVHLGRAKGRGKRGYEGRGKNEVAFEKFPLLREIQTLSHKLLVRQTSNHCHCNQHAQKPKCREFQVISKSTSWSKTTLFVYFKEQIWPTNRKCYGKIMKCYEQALSLPLESKYICLKQIRWVQVGPA